MQLPRLAVLFAVYSGVHATLSPDETTEKPETKLESNQTGGSRFLGLGSPPAFSSLGYGINGLGSYQPQYVQSSAQAQAQFQSQPPVYSPGSQPQPQAYRVPSIQGTPYRTQPQYAPYSGMSGGVVEQMTPIGDDGYPSASSKFGSYQGVSMNPGSSSGSLGGMSLPQTFTVFGNIPVSVSGTLNLGVRGQLSVMQGGSGISIGSSPYTHQGSPSYQPYQGSPSYQPYQGSPSYQPYQGSSGGTITGSLPASQQSSGVLSPVSPYAPALEGPFNPIESQLLKSQGGVSPQVHTNPNSGNSENSGMVMFIIRPYAARYAL